MGLARYSVLFSLSPCSGEFSFYIFLLVWRTPSILQAINFWLSTCSFSAHPSQGDFCHVVFIRIHTGMNCVLFALVASSSEFSQVLQFCVCLFHWACVEFPFLAVSSSSSPWSFSSWCVRLFLVQRVVMPQASSFWVACSLPTQIPFHVSSTMYDFVSMYDIFMVLNYDYLEFLLVIICDY